MAKKDAMYLKLPSHDEEPPSLPPRPKLCVFELPDLSSGSETDRDQCGLNLNLEHVKETDMKAVEKTFSMDEFGKILQLSQWSLRHRIEVCKVLQNPTYRCFMSPLSRHAYAKQSLALIGKDLKDVCEEPLAPSFEQCHMRMQSTYGREYVQFNMEYLQDEVEKMVFQNWKQLTEDLEVEVQRLRGENMNEDWYISLSKRGNFFQVEDLYILVEKGNEKEFGEEMEKIGREQWASIRPLEYRGATPWHWAVLHNFRCNQDNDHAWRHVLRTRDELDFTLMHMAIFASSKLPFRSTRKNELEEGSAISNCVKMVEDLYRYYESKGDYVQGEVYDQSHGEYDGSCSRPTFHFLIFKLASSSKSSVCFVAKQYVSTPIHFVQLLVWIGHPVVIEMMMSRLRDTKLLNVRTKSGDSILHLAAWGMDPDVTSDYGVRQRVMVILLRNLHWYPSLLNSANAVGQTPFHIAAFQGSSKCVEALSTCPYLKVDVTNKNGFTPLQIATKLMDQKVVEQRMYAKILGRKCDIDEEFGFPTFKYDDLGIEPITFMPMEHGRNYKEISTQMKTMEPEILRQWHVLQSSEWSLRLRLLALQMLDENVAKLGYIRDTYIKQCLKLIQLWIHSTEDKERIEKIDKLVESVNQSIEGSHIREYIVDELRKQLIKKERSDGKTSKSKELASTLGRIYTAVEEDDYGEFQKMMDTLKGEWAISAEEYQGATPLHWAILYGRKDMVSFIKGYIVNKRLDVAQKTRAFKVREQETWSATVNARDKFEFTPLHLAVLSSPFCLGYSNEDQDSKDEKIKNCVELIDMLYEMGVPHSASNNSQQFLVWSLAQNSIFVDDYLSNSCLYPIYLGVHFAHPRIIEKLLESSPEQAFAKNIMSSGDSILHYAGKWEILIKKCSEDEWRKIESIVLMHLDNVPKAVNARNFNRDTPLHIAVSTKSAKWMEVLLQCEHMKFNFRDLKKYTPGELAANKLKSEEEKEHTKSEEDKKLTKEEIELTRDIISLIDCFDPESWPRQREEKEKYIEALQRERQVYVDAANAILVGAALIASASFGAWLQPPLGLHPYYSPEFLDPTVPPTMGPVYEAFVPIQQYWTIQMFWIFNSLSFFFSLSTVIAGANAALPQQVEGVPSLVEKAQADVTSVKRAVAKAAFLFVYAIGFVVCTFATVGFTVLPPIRKYQKNMMVTVGLGGFVCAWSLITLVRKLFSKEKVFHILFR